MGFRQRLLVMGLVVAMGLLAYIVASYYSRDLVEFVVIEALIQKSPPGVNPAALREDLRHLLEAAPGRDAKLQKLLSLSQSLEKVQKLSPEQLSRLLEKDAGAAPRDRR